MCTDHFDGLKPGSVFSTKIDTAHEVYIEFVNIHSAQI